MVLSNLNPWFVVNTDTHAHTYTLAYTHISLDGLKVYKTFIALEHRYCVVLVTHLKRVWFLLKTHDIADSAERLSLAESLT